MSLQLLSISYAYKRFSRHLQKIPFTPKAKTWCVEPLWMLEKTFTAKSVIDIVVVSQDQTYDATKQYLLVLLYIVYFF